ncbi:MAG TPA: ABC transporter ATP-binding protein [Cyclobacteriaceae bacterium]|nr:ABC transporter ATP-binding protein [Cyclobacteriaceae bacterium]
MEIVSQPLSLQASQISVGYHTAHSETILFDEINLSLTPGKLTCFMGPNGIGKSTLIRVLAGLQKPLCGTITSQGERGIALVLTDKITATNMAVWDLVSYGRYPYLNLGISLSDHDYQIIEQAIADVGINGLSHKKLEELSDGQLQLAMIARALAQETPVLLLDEPTAHLDLNHRVVIMKLLHRLTREKNKAILVATHELDLALQMADQVWLATPHRKIKTGIPEDLVLDGSFDDVFQFKGFDLKTGKIQHDLFRNTNINLVGEGYEYLWTKNALEREGFSVSAGENALSVVVSPNTGNLTWRCQGSSFDSLEGLINRLKKS